MTVQQAMLSGPAGLGSVTLNDWTVSASRATQASAEIIINYSGDTVLGQVTNSTSTTSYTWTTGAAADYEFCVTVLSGSLTTGTPDVWSAFNSLGTVGIIANASNGNNKACTFLLRCRHAASGVEVARATYTMTAVYT